MLLFALQPIIGAILLYPLWEIFRRLGRDPKLSLLALLPVAGLMVVALILALGRWPAVDRAAPDNPVTS